MVRQIENYISLPFSSKPLTLKINTTLLCIFFVLFEIIALCMAQVLENGREGERVWGAKFPQLKVRQRYSLEFKEIKQIFKNVFETILANEKIFRQNEDLKADFDMYNHSQTMHFKSLWMFLCS